MGMERWMTNLTDGQRRVALEVLQSSEALPESAAKLGVDAVEARAWIDAYLAEKAVLGPERMQAGVGGEVEIVRDRRGVPHIRAERSDDLYFGLGFAQAQDRLWQLDYLRRQAHGTLSEVFGADTLAGEILSRTLDITGIAEATLARIDP